MRCRCRLESAGLQPAVVTSELLVLRGWATQGSSTARVCGSDAVGARGRVYTKDLRSSISETSGMRINSTRRFF